MASILRGSNKATFSNAQTSTSAVKIVTGATEMHCALTQGGATHATAGMAFEEMAADAKVCNTKPLKKYILQMNITFIQIKTSVPPEKTTAMKAPLAATPWALMYAGANRDSLAMDAIVEEHPTVSP